MRLCVLDCSYANPGDLSWERLEKIGETTIYQFTRRAEVLERAAGMDILITGGTPLSRETIFELPNLKYIGVMGTGYNVVDVAAARERGVTVTNVPDYCGYAVAQHAISLLLQLTNRVWERDEKVRKAGWLESKGECFASLPVVELYQKTMGIIGYGSIGKTVAGIALALGMNVLVSGRTPKPVAQGCCWVSREELLQKSDVISLHCPLTVETENLIDKNALNRMKKSAVLINTARGGLVDEEALAQALAQGKIAGAGLDVLRREPPKGGSPLLGVKNCIVTPHVSVAARETRARLITRTVQNIELFLAGQPQNVVN